MRERAKNKIRQVAATRTGKVLLALWLLSAAALVGFPTYGYFQGEFLGGVAFTILVLAVLVNSSIVLAVFVRQGTEKIVKVAWILLCLLAEFTFILMARAVYDPPQLREETGIILAYLMLTLSFPSGLVILAFPDVLQWLWPPVLPHGIAVTPEMGFYISNSVAWLLLFIVGYLQWFKLLPYLLGKLRMLRKNAARAEL